MPSVEGRFPFGLPSGRCESRRAEPASAFVLGVYPSALHVRWTHPDYRVAALAVAPEPWPFWDGADQEKRVSAWRDEVKWQDAWGKAEPAGRLNGSSGQAVRDRVLEPLGLALDAVWLTDALPFFHVHRGAGTQGAAMTERYDAFARELGLPLHDLPDRPSVDALINRAVKEEGQRLRAELLESDAPLVITLGNEALAVAAHLLEGDLPNKLRPDADYGRRLPARLAGRALEVLPLVHPGQRSDVWQAAHTGWLDDCG